MIGRQIPFLFLDGVDASTFYESIKQAGVEILASRSPTSGALKLEWPTQEWLLYLAPADQIAELAPRFVEEQGYWTLDPMSDPVVEWSIFQEKEGLLRAGRLYYVPRDSDGAEWRERPQMFLDFAKRVRRTAERLAPLTGLADGTRARLGQSARQRYEARGLRLTRR